MPQNPAAAWQSTALCTTMLTDEFLQVRLHTEQLCASLQTEDYVVQPAPFVSPPKWHLAHTSWFFDRFLLSDAGDSTASDDSFNLLFNSYYKSQGTHWAQECRGHLSRPTVAEIYRYRQEVSERVSALLQLDRLSQWQVEVLLTGIEHEKQHQELLLMDIKYILGGNCPAVAYDAVSQAVEHEAGTRQACWLAFAQSRVEFGAGDDIFAYDNERPRHARVLHGFQLADAPVSNRDYLDFIEDGGYQCAQWWLSDGWDWVTRHGIEHPLYWSCRDGEWFEYHLGGTTKLARGLPVTHISFYEADAFARWAGARLPTEFELEYLLAGDSRVAANESLAPFWAPGEVVCPLRAKASDVHGNGLVWQWTSSAYGPYPGFVPQTGALAEYNGKFMCNQYVLKGGSVATPRRHVRESYRNFFRPHDRWAFTGLRLAKDVI